MMNDKTLDTVELKAKLQTSLERVLNGETVEIGIFRVYEDFLYEGKKDQSGSPLFNRVLALVYFDEEDDDDPSTEEFDGSIESFIAALDAHDVLSAQSGFGEEELECL